MLPAIPPRRLIYVSVVVLSLSISFSTITICAQVSDVDRDRARVMLREIKNDIREHYYDPNFRGIDLDARFRTAEERVSQATSNGMIFAIIAQMLSEFRDSHLYFIPPRRAARVEYGWHGRMIGDQAYVIAVKPGSDADTKGLRPGDRILAVDNLELTRENMHIFQYLYYTLRPQAGMRLIVQSPGGQPRRLEIVASVQRRRQTIDLTGDDEGVGIYEMIREEQREARLHRHRFAERTPDMLIWNMPQFNLSESQIDEIMSRARRHRAMILDLRGNGGGRISTLTRLLGHFFDRDVTIGELQRRRRREPLIARTRGGDRVFTGRLIVLVDSESASSAEMFARIIQLERRGTVVGDRTAGAVMQSITRPHRIGAETIIEYYVSVTDADITMTDGRSLERVGVTPDEVLLPTGADLAANRDPVLSRAARMLELDLTPERAGTMFPIEWRR
jgi:carboxyl-terminal processing protease